LARCTRRMKMALMTAMKSKTEKKESAFRRPLSFIDEYNETIIRLKDSPKKIASRNLKLLS